MQYIPLITLALVAVLLVLVIILLLRRPAPAVPPARAEDSSAITALGALVSQNLKEGREAQLTQLSAMDRSLSGKMGSVTEQLGQFERRLHGFTAETTQNLENIRATVDQNLRAM